MSNIIYVSEVGLELLRNKLERINEELTFLREEKSRAYTATGDTWHDNPYFNKLEQDEKRKSQDMSNTQSLIANARLFIFGEKRNIDRVQIGSIVSLKRYPATDTGEDQFVWEITCYGETDVSQKRVAYDSPMARSIIGLGVGDFGESTGPGGVVEYEIIELYPDWESVPA